MRTFLFTSARRFTQRALWLLAILSCSALADDSLDPLLKKLSSTKLSKAPALATQIEAAGGESALPLFEAWLAGELYYDQKAKSTLYRVTENDHGDLVATHVLSGEEKGIIEKRTVKKIKVNNKLRGQLRQMIARINLSASDPKQRLAAVTSMLGKVDDDVAELLEAAKLEESDSKVYEAINLNLALYKLEEGDEAEQLAALEVLNGSVEPAVRNQIVSLLEDEPSATMEAALNKALKNIDNKLAWYQRTEQLFFGLSMGSVFLLAAMGLAITFGVMGVINMAHGEMIMLGAYTTYVVQQVMVNSIGYSLWVAIPAAFLVSGIVGIIIQQLVIKHLNGRPLETLLATFGISLILQQAVRTIFSPLNRQVTTPDWMSGSLEINAALSLTYNRLYILVFALIVFFAVQLILNKTSLGLKVRAVSQNRAMAKSMGIRTDWVDAMTFGLGSGIAGIAGVALSQLTNVGPNLGQGYIIDSFMVVVFGGVGNLLGTLVAGFSLGIANKLLEPATGAMLANILILVFIILFIQKRPQGLFPQKGRAAND